MGACAHFSQLHFHSIIIIITSSYVRMVRRTYVTLRISFWRGGEQFSLAWRPAGHLFGIKRESRANGCARHLFMPIARSLLQLLHPTLSWTQSLPILLRFCTTFPIVLQCFRRLLALLQFLALAPLKPH